MSIVLKAEGTVSVDPPTTAVATDTGGCTYPFSLIDQHRSPTHEVSSREFVFSVSSPSFTSLVPQHSSPSTLKADFIYLRTKNGESIVVELTHETAGAVEYGVRGVLLMELPEAERVTDVKVQGTATIEYIFSGKME